MRKFLEEKTKQRFKGYSEKELKHYASGSGKIFAILSEQGEVIDTRKTSGSAYRAIEKRRLLRRENSEQIGGRLHVVAINIRDLVISN